ncbi:MAG: sulfotransferase [Thermoplasmata archaeon]
MQGLLFLVGCPRSGKTTAHDILASSGRFAWISNLQDSYPRLDSISFFNRKYDIPFFGLRSYLNKNEDDITTPVQGNDFWKAHIKGFEPKRFEDENAVPVERRDPPGLKTGEKIPEEEKEDAREVVENICMWQGKDHFLSEYALWSRMSFFREIFPESKFVHVVRDGRAVAHEYRKMIEDGEYPEGEEMEWWLRGWPDRWRREFEEDHGSFLTFCAFQWKFIVKMIRDDAENIPEDRYMEVKYRDMVERPEETISSVFDFYGLEYNQRIQRYLKMKKFENRNREWREELNHSQKEELDGILYESEYAEILDGR